MNRRGLLALACVTTLPVWSASASVVDAPLAMEPAGEGLWQAHHENVLGTSLEVVVRASSATVARAAEDAALAEFDRQSAILSAWDEQSEFSRWQKTRGKALAVSPELLSTLARFDYWRRETGGVLNASSAAGAAVWQRAAVSGGVPEEHKLQEAVATMGAPQWRLDAVAGTAERTGDAPLVLASFVKSRISAAAAEAAMRAGAVGVMLNVGGDVLVRGRVRQRVSVADPGADAENDAALETVMLEDRAIATSGGYRRGFHVDGEHVSHLIDARTGMVAREVLQASVIAEDAETAGALATAFAIAGPEDAERLAERHPGVEYLLVMRDGREIRSAGWVRFAEPRMVFAAYRPDGSGARAFSAASEKPGVVESQANYELTVKLTLPRIDDPRYRRPYVAVWVEDESHYPVKTLALWFQKPRWLNELKTWYRDDRLRNLTEGTDLSATISSATRPPGTYTLKWDGKDNEGKPVKPGRYTLCAEASREHGGYGMVRHEIDLGGGAVPELTLPAQPEIGTVALALQKR